MALFNRKNRRAESERMANDIAQNRGFLGKLANAIAGPELAEALQSAQGLSRAADLRAGGAPTYIANVVSVQDTGVTINDNPRVALMLDLGTQQLTIATLVSRLEIPRTGDRVVVVQDPQNGQLLYAGLAPRA